MLTVKQVKLDADKPSPIYAEDQYVVLSYDNVVLHAGSWESIQDLPGYYNNCEVKARAHDIYLANNTKIAAVTPGPWEVCDDKTGVYAPDTDTAITNPEHFCFPEPDKAAANFRLIAAAPDLLEALKEITQRYALLDARLVAGQHSEPNGTIERARAAIAKATGNG